MLQVALCKLMNPFMNNVAVTCTRVQTNTMRETDASIGMELSVMHCLTLDKPKCIRVFGCATTLYQLWKYKFLGWLIPLFMNHTHTRPDLCVLWLDTTHSIPIWIQTWACGIEASKHGNKIVNLLNMKFAWGFDRICMPLTSQCLPYVCKIARNTQIQTLCCKQLMTKQCIFWFMQPFLSGGWNSSGNCRKSKLHGKMHIDVRIETNIYRKWQTITPT